MTDQVQQARRRLFDATHHRDVNTLVLILKLPRAEVIDALMLCADTVLPPVNVHSVWLEWERAMRYANIDERVSFLHYLRDQLAAWRKEQPGVFRAHA